MGKRPPWAWRNRFRDALYANRRTGYDLMGLARSTFYGAVWKLTKEGSSCHFGIEKRSATAVFELGAASDASIGNRSSPQTEFSNGFYDVPLALLANDALLARIGAIYDEFECYGIQRVGAALRHQGMVVNGKKLRRIIREYDL